MELEQFRGGIRAPSDRVAAATVRHVTITTAGLTRVLATTIDSLEEPRASNPELALHRLGYLVETLLGAAAGAVIGRVVSAVLRGLGSDLGQSLELRLREALLRIGPGRGTPRTGALNSALPAFVTDAAVRPLVDELGARMHPRLAHTRADHEGVLLRLATAVPAEHASTFASTIALLDDDPMVLHLWSEHLRLAWCCYTAAVSNLRDAAPTIPPDLATSTCCKTWRAWLRRVRGERDVAAPAEPNRSNYIMAVLG